METKQEIICKWKHSYLYIKTIASGLVLLGAIFLYMDNRFDKIYNMLDPITRNQQKVLQLHPEIKQAIIIEANNPIMFLATLDPDFIKNLKSK